MLHLKQFNENSLNSDILLFHDKPVMVVNVEHLTSSEVSISYMHEDGTIGHFCGEIDDFDEVFKPGDDIKFKRKKKRAARKPRKPQLDPNKTYNLVYYVGNKKVETLKWNLPISLARGLKKQYSSFPQYKSGEIKLEIN